MKNNLNLNVPRFKQQFDPNYVPEKGIFNTEASETTPDMGLTVRELLLNHTRGLNDFEVYDPEYFDSEIPVFKDLTDMDTHKKYLQERLNTVNNDIKDEKQRIAEQTPPPQKEPLTEV